MSPSDWEFVNCDLCGSAQREVLFSLPHSAAPNGSSEVAKCESCGLIYISPRPKPEHLSACYPSSVNAYIGRTRGIAKQMAWDVARRVGLDLCDISLRVPSGHRLLDVGCGYGDLLLHYRSCGVICVGIDFSKLAVAKAHEYGLDVRLGSLHTQNFKESQFDAIIMCHSLEHIPYPLQTIAEIRRILKPGGVVQIAVPNAESPHFGPSWQHISFPLHLYHFTTATLMRCLDGFSEVTSRIRRRTDAVRVSAKL